MKTISSVYSEYKIMPMLRLHQLRVAAVAKTICDSISQKLNTEGVVRVCLLHDMGNIIKSDLTYFPDFLKPLGLEYWQGVKDEYIKKYGNDEHVATQEICREIGLSEEEKSYLNAIGFSKTKTVLVSNSLEKKICCYADQRVGPHGVLLLEERLAEGKMRYAGRANKAIASNQFDELADALRSIEAQVFSSSNLKPESITDDVIQEIISDLGSKHI
jgi:hypothetical protein